MGRAKYLKFFSLGLGKEICNNILYKFGSVWIFRAPSEGGGGGVMYQLC